MTNPDPPTPSDYLITCTAEDVHAFAGDPDPDPDPEQRDEGGLTAAERDRWRAMHTAIATMVEVALGESPTPGEARRRLGLLRLELHSFDAAVTLNEPTWNITQRTL